MKSKLIATVAATLLAGTVYAGAQSGAPSNENDRTGQPTDSSQNAAKPQRGGGASGGTVGGGGGMSGAAGGGGTSSEPLQPGGVSPSAPPQGRETGGSANPRPR